MANKLTKLLPAAETASIGYPSPPRASKEDREAMEMRERRYRAEDALRCLTRAQEIMKDSQLMRDVRQIAKEQMQSLQRLSPSARR